MENKKTHSHSLKVRGHIFYVDLAYASHLYTILGSQSDLIEIKNDEKKIYMKVYKREVCLVPLSDIDIIIYNCVEPKRNTLLLFIDERKTRGVPTTPRQLQEFLKIKEKKGEPHQ